MKLKCLFVATLLCTSASTMAEWSSTVTLANDYLFNGVSQTDESPALQASLDWAGESGFYAGVWGSNVDFGDDTNLEADGYVGYYQALTDLLNLDVGIAQYTYQGANYSSDGNYAEAYMKWNVGNTNLNIWYAWDYFGTGAGHYIVMLNHTIEVTDVFSVLVGVDKSTSLDDDKWTWEENDDAYIHWQITGLFSFKSLDFTLGVQGTDLDTYGDTKVLLTMAHTFNF